MAWVRSLTADDFTHCLHIDAAFLALVREPREEIRKLALCNAVIVAVLTYMVEYELYPAAAMGLSVGHEAPHTVGNFTPNHGSMRPHRETIERRDRFGSITRIERISKKARIGAEPARRTRALIAALLDDGRIVQVRAHRSALDRALWPWKQ